MATTEICEGAWGIFGINHWVWYSSKTSHDLLKKNTFTWSEEAEIAFHNLKRARTQALVLALPDFSIRS